MASNSFTLSPALTDWLSLTSIVCLIAFYASLRLSDSSSSGLSIGLSVVALIDQLMVLGFDLAKLAVQELISIATASTIIIVSILKISSFM